MQDRLGVACALLIAIAEPAAGQNAPQDYPQWRGRQGDGSAAAFIVPAIWPDALTRVWHVDVGEGYATPLVVGETVYVFTRRDGNEVIAALDAATGVERWRSAYPLPYAPSSPTVAHGSGPKATPLFHEGKLFTVGITGIVSAFDARSGTRLWQTDAPAEMPFYSAAASPVGVPGLVIAHPGNYGPLTAFDVNTGAVKWTAGAGGFFMSPLIVSLAGTEQVVSVTQDGVIGVSPGDGAVLWRYPWPGGGMGGTMPIAYRDTIIVSASRNGVTALRPIKRDAGWEVETVWQTTDVSMYLSNPVVVGDALYGLSQRSSGEYFALDAQSGRVLWLGPPRQATNTAVVKAGDLLFLLDDDGELIVAKANRAAFEPLKRYMVADSATWAQPAITGKRIFVKDDRVLTLWTVE
ncbi:MAG TPA: PQQ-binding-like beta-propeller repeat protein [Vicinamibacterales bacterium]|nr:PQQ-binding-like beta-propeller repeat protein [Vicinamibacterales bacterium]